MSKKMKRLFAAALAAGAIMVSGMTAMAATSPTAAPDAVVDPTGVVKTVYTTQTNGNHTLTSVVKTNKKTITLPETVVVKGETVDLNKIGHDAFKNAKKVKTINLSKKTKYLNKKAFKGCKKLTTITFKGTKSFKTVKDTFKGVDTSKITFKVNKKMKASEFKKLQKQLKKAGFKGKVVKAKLK